MSSSKLNTASPSRNNAGNASPLRAKLQAALDAYDKENAAGPSGTPPIFRPPDFSRHSLPGSMNINTNKSPFHANQGSAAGSKPPHSIRGRLSDGGAILNQGGGGLANAFQLKTKKKRSASVAEMDEPSSASKRPRREDSEAPFVFIKNMKLLHEDNILARRMFLDLVEAQDKRVVYGGHNPKEIYTMGPCIDPKDLFEKQDASLIDTHLNSVLDKVTPNYSIIQESEGDSIFGSWFQQLLSKEDEKDQRKGEAGSSQERGYDNTPAICDILPEENRAAVAEAPARCETSGDDGSPAAPLPRIEADICGRPLEANLDHNLPSSPHGSNTNTQVTSIPPPVAQAPPEVVPEASHSPTAKKTIPDNEKKRERNPKAMQARPYGITSPGVAGPSTGPFEYSDARAQEIWKLAQLGDYLGAHALFDPAEQVVLIKGGKNVQKYLKKDPKLKKRLEDSPEGADRECLYVCGASAIWKRIGNPKEETPEYQLTYKRCKDRAYATADNYKKHVYRYHLHKHYKMYKKEAGEDEEEKEEPAKGKGKAPE